MLARVGGNRAREVELFERYQEDARQTIVLSQDEARLMKHNYIGTEHLLLGLLRVDGGVAAQSLAALDVRIEPVRAQCLRMIGEGDSVMPGQIPFTPRAKRVLELGLREALSLGHNYIGTEHILLGLVRENEGVAARILLDFDADPDKVRNEVIARLPAAQRDKDEGVPLTDVRVTYDRLRQIIREEIAGPTPDTAEVPRAKFVFTDDEHRTQCAAAGCQHPAVYFFGGADIQGWCQLCRAVAFGSA